MGNVIQSPNCWTLSLTQTFYWGTSSSFSISYTVKVRSLRLFKLFSLVMGCFQSKDQRNFNVTVKLILMQNLDFYGFVNSSLMMVNDSTTTLLCCEDTVWHVCLPCPFGQSPEGQEVLSHYDGEEIIEEFLWQRGTKEFRVTSQMWSGYSKCSFR